MDLAELQKLGVLETGNQPQNPGLFAVSQMVLKTDHSKSIGHQIFLSKLHARVRLFAGSRIAQALWLHRAETQSLDAAAGDLFDRQTRSRTSAYPQIALPAPISPR